MLIGPLHRARSRSAGFTLVEIAVTILLLGMLFALAVPTVSQLSGSYHLKTASENLAGQIRLGRERAIATGVNQHFHFITITNADYFIIDHMTAVQTGNWKFPKGVTYFNGAGTCSTCHSVTGDLAGIASRLQGLELERQMLMPRRAQSKVTVTAAGGKTITGTLAYHDEFMIGLTDSTGGYHSWPASSVKFKIDNPTDGHVKLLSKYSDDDIHNLMAYLQTLK